MSENENNKNTTEFKISLPLLEKGLDALKGFLEKAIGPSATELGLMFGDGLKIRRTRNMIKNLEKVSALAEKYNIKLKQINLKALFPYLEGVSLEEDDTLQDMWANLFLNYVDSEIKMLTTVYPDILKHLSTREAEILKHMYVNGGKLRVGTRNFVGNFIVEYEDLQNLERLRLIEPESNFSLYGGSSDPKIEELEPIVFYTTSFGDGFIKSCMPRERDK